MHRARDEVLALSAASLSFYAQAQAAIANLTNDQKSTLGTGAYFWPHMSIYTLARRVLMTFATRRTRAYRGCVPVDSIH